MIIRPRLQDLKVIGLYTGKVISGFGLLMLIPLAASLLFGEWNPAVEFTVGFGACMAAGMALQVLCQTTADLTWAHGLVVASFSWFMATALAAIPHWLSGHFGSFIDAGFDIMSGLTTTGLYLIQDLDHVSHGLNMYRHLLSYVGGQGLIVLALTFLFRGTAGAYKMYVGEAKDERLLPNVIQTARAIWVISVAYLLAGTLALWITGMSLGQSFPRGFLHGMWMFMGSWSTGGFAPMSYNASYYHSFTFEAFTTFWMVAGSINFATHWAVWTGDRAEIRRNIETVSFFLTMTLTMALTAAALVKAGLYPDAFSLFRKVYYSIVSGHTGTGHAVIYSRAFVTQWGTLAMTGVILAMAFGAGICSTCGGFKGLRIGIIFKSILQEIRRIISPESARVSLKWHHLKDRILDDATVKMAMLIVLSYIGIYALGTVAGVWYGYDLVSAAFDSVSAGANVGYSCGVTDPSMPTVLKYVYIFCMWAGRLEFLSLFALGGYIWAMVKGR